LLRGAGSETVDLWAVHGGGRTVLDAVEIGLCLGREALRYSRAVLRDYGNMSSATVMLVLARMLADGAANSRGHQPCYPSRSSNAALPIAWRETTPSNNLRSIHAPRRYKTRSGSIYSLAPLPLPQMTSASQQSCSRRKLGSHT
jgi:hypothetical protein